MFDKDLIHALIGGKDLDCGAAELCLNLRFENVGAADLGLSDLGLARGHGSVLHDLSYFQAGEIPGELGEHP